MVFSCISLADCFPKQIRQKWASRMSCPKTRRSEKDLFNGTSRMMGMKNQTEINQWANSLVGYVFC